MSSSHQAPDLTAELFVLEPRDRDHPALVPDYRIGADARRLGGGVASRRRFL